MKRKYGLVLEGGALRGLFTAGVLDYFMEKNIVFPYVIGVSAGACNAISYISGQIDRTRRVMMHEGEDSYYGKTALKNCGRIIDLDLVMKEYPYKQYPFDFAAYFSSGIEREYVVTDMKSGLAEYMTDSSDEKKLANIVMASSSMPIVSNPVYIDGVPYLDGGIADPVPVKRAFLRGCKKCVVILTKPEDYKAKDSLKNNATMRLIYRKYPALIDVCMRKKEIYSQRMQLLTYLERAGMAYVIRPSIPEIRKLESDEEKLKEYYSNGYEIAKRRYEDVIRFLGEDKVKYDD